MNNSLKGCHELVSGGYKHNLKIKQIKWVQKGLDRIKIKITSKTGPSWTTFPTPWGKWRSMQRNKEEYEMHALKGNLCFKASYLMGKFSVDNFYSCDLTQQIKGFGSK